MDSDLMRWVKAQADDPNANPRFRELLAALCRRWLAVEDAEVAHVEPKNGLAVLHERCMPLAMIGQRVRLVREYNYD